MYRSPYFVHRSHTHTHIRTFEHFRIVLLFIKYIKFIQSPSLDRLAAWGTRSALDLSSNAFRWEIRPATAAHTPDMSSDPHRRRCTCPHDTPADRNAHNHRRVADSTRPRADRRMAAVRMGSFSRRRPRAVGRPAQTVASRRDSCTAGACRIGGNGTQSAALVAVGADWMWSAAVEVHQPIAEVMLWTQRRSMVRTYFVCRMRGGHTIKLQLNTEAQKR